ncbi:MAG: hypothetical protein ACOC9R_03555 [bacterium]
MSDVVGTWTDEDLRLALRDVASTGSWDGPSGRRLLRAVRERAVRNAAHIAAATGVRCDRDLVGDVVTAAWTVLHGHTEQVLDAERPWAYLMRAAQQEVMAEALADRAVTSRTVASGRNRQQVWTTLVSRVGAAAGQVAAALGHGHRVEGSREQSGTGPIVTASRRAEPKLVERPHEASPGLGKRDGWYAAFIGLLVAHGADGRRTTTAVDHLANLFSVTPSKQWETAARRDPVLARLGLSAEQASALVALVAGSRRDREAGRPGGLLGAVRAAWERGEPVTLSAVDHRRVRTYIDGTHLERRRPAAERRLAVAADAVRTEMARAGVTQETLAVRLGLRRQNVATRLSGIVGWTRDELTTVADVLTVPVERLLHWHPAEGCPPDRTGAEAGRNGRPSRRLLPLPR